VDPNNPLVQEVVRYGSITITTLWTTTTHQAEVVLGFTRWSCILEQNSTVGWPPRGRRDRTTYVHINSYKNGISVKNLGILSNYFRTNFTEGRLNGHLLETVAKLLLEGDSWTMSRTWMLGEKRFPTRTFPENLLIRVSACVEILNLSFLLLHPLSWWS
jgi:hypothetical protein